MIIAVQGQSKVKWVTTAGVTVLIHASFIHRVVFDVGAVRGWSWSWRWL